MLTDLRRALESDEILIHYQPIVDAHTGAAVSAEGWRAGSTPSSG